MILMWLSAEYQKLSLEQKAEIVWQRGTYLMCRCKSNYAVTLHEWEGQFIEIWLDATQKRVTLLFAFRQSASLQPYLEKLPLPEWLPLPDTTAAE